VTCLLDQNVVPYVSTFAEKVVGFYLVHASSSVVDPLAMLTRLVLMRNLEVIECILEIVKLVLYGTPLPATWETDLVSAQCHVVIERTQAFKFLCKVSTFFSHI
jgi:hypothetical protein